MAGKAQGGIVEADGFKILPRFLFLSFCEQVGHPGHQQKHIGLLDYLAYDWHGQRYVRRERK